MCNLYNNFGFIVDEKMRFLGFILYYILGTQIKQVDQVTLFMNLQHQDKIGYEIQNL